MRAHIYICVCLLKMYVCYYFLLGLVVTRRHGLADRLRVLYGLRDLFNWSAAATVSERLGLRLRKFCSSNGNITINTSVSFSMRTSYSRLLLGCRELTNPYLGIFPIYSITAWSLSFSYWIELGAPIEYMSRREDLKHFRMNE